MRFPFVHSVILSPLLLALAGCSSEPTEEQKLEEHFGGPLKTVVPVSGTIHVNGKPEAGVLISLHPENGAKPLAVRSPYTNEDGEFEFTTYRQGDGIEPGKYKLTFQWKEVVNEKKKGATLKGPDKFNQSYSDAKKSQFSLTVEDDEPVTDLTFDLKTN